MASPGARSTPEGRSTVIRACKEMVATIRSLPRMVDLLAQTLTGGLVVSSVRDRDGAQEIFAQTIVQLDGDVVTSLPPALLKTPDGWELLEQHVLEVCRALRPLSRLRTAICWARWSLCSLGGVWAALALPGAWQRMSLGEVVQLAVPILVVAVGWFCGGILRWLAWLQAGRLLKEATRQAEIIYAGR